MLTKYVFLLKRLKVFDIMAFCGLVPTFLLCCLPWGSYGWMGRLDFMKLPYEEACKRFIDLNLDRNVNMYISGNASVIEAGTGFKVLGYYQTLPEREGVAGWLVETEDDRRGVCNIGDLPEVRKRSYLLVHDHSREEDLFKFHTIAYKDDINKLISKRISFDDFEKEFGPAIYVNYNPELAVYVAKYRGIDYSFDGYIWHLLQATFYDGKLVSVKALGSNDSWVLNFFAPFADNWMKHSAAYISPGFYLPDEGHGILQSSFYPYKWVARGVMGIVDVLFAFLVGAIANLIVILLFAGNKSIDNSFLSGIVVLICGTAYTLYCYFTMEFSANLFCYGFASIAALAYGASFSEYRCPNCNNLVELEIVDQKFGEVETKVYDYHDSDDTVIEKKRIEDTSLKQIDQEVVDTEYFTRRTTEEHRKVTTTYRCPICGHTHSSTSDETLSRRHRKFVTRVERMVHTRTTTFHKG